MSLILKKDNFRINEKISAKNVRVIDEKGMQLGILKREEALAKAREANLDLVEVAPNVEPPVCRIINFGKFKYKQKKKTHQKHHSSQLKEIRLRPKTSEHDLQIKIKQAIKFIERKDRVVVNMMFKGREAAHAEIGKEIMEKFIKAMQDVSKIEKESGLMGKKMVTIFSPK